MAYPSKPTGNDILPFDTIFADNNNLKTAMTTNEILNGYNNDGETETQLTSRPDANRFNMFWYQVHNTIKWIVSYIEELYTSKLEKSGGTMTGILDMGANKIKSTYTPVNPEDIANKNYVDKRVSGNAMWVGEVKTLSYPTIPQLPDDIEVVPCDGRAVSRIIYADYFAMVGTAFGSGDGSTTFNIPDYRGMFLRGWDGNSGRDKNRVYGTIQQSGVPNITGFLQGSNQGGAEGAFYKSGGADSGADWGGGYRGIRVNFNASRVSSVYTDNLTEARGINGSCYWVVRIK